MSEHYARDGRRISLFEWGSLMEDWRYRVIRQTHLPSGVEVSTVWLGLNHGFPGRGRPVIFETMVFPEGTVHDLACDRYCTEQEARAGHEAMMKRWRFKKWNRRRVS